MAGNKKSFLLHIDSLDILDELTDEECGLLFKAIRAHHTGDEIELTGLVRVAFSPFRNQFNRDGEKYEKLCEKNRLIAVNRHLTKSTSGTNGKPTSPVVTKSTDNDSDIKDPLVQPKVKPKRVKFNDYQMDFAKWMFSLILKLNPNNKKPNLESWASTIRLMMESDDRNGDHMVEVFTWANMDHFWKSNILSPAKFRIQFDAIVIKMNNGGSQSTGQPQERTQAEVDQFTAELNDQYERSQAAKQRKLARSNKL